jgi:hypothetical protein
LHQETGHHDGTIRLAALPDVAIDLDQIFAA